MAYEIIGTVHKIGTTGTIPTRTGGQLQKRTLVLVQRRFDQNTGEEFDPNYPSIEFSQRGCAELDRFKPGDRVRVRFDISGVRYEDKSTHQEKYFTTLRGFRIEPYVTQQPRQVAQPQGYPPQSFAPQGFAPQQQSSYNPTSPASQPFPPQGGGKEVLPF